MFQKAGIVNLKQDQAQLLKHKFNQDKQFAEIKVVKVA